MRILFLTSRLPWPPDRGDRVRTYHFLRVMAKVHDVTLLSFTDGTAPEGSRRALRELGARVETVERNPAVSAAQMARAFAGGQPLQVAYYRSAEMKLRARQLAADRDVVIAHLVRMAPYLAEAPAGARRIVDLCDCISSEYVASLPHRSVRGRWFFSLEARRLAPYERHTATAWDESWVISEAEVAKLGFRDTPPQLHVVPNGVVVPEPAGGSARGGGEAGGGATEGDAKRDAGAARPPRIVFTGHFGVPHNIDAAKFLVREILPLVRRDVPDAVVQLAGADPVPEVKELAAPGVEVTGWVDDLFGLLRAADVFVAPLRFVAGVQNKILEALAAGCPVVTTEAARLGLGAAAGDEMLVGDTAAEIAGHTVALLRSPDDRRRLSGAGAAFVRTQFAWDAVLERLS